MPTVNAEQIDRFNAPIPGEMLTAELGARPWQRPPQYSEVEDVLNYYVDKMTKPKVSANAVSIMESGVPLTMLSETIMTANVMEGVHTIDSGILVIPFIVEMLEYLADEAGVKVELGLEEEEDNSVIDSLAAKKAFERFEEETGKEIPEGKAIEEQEQQEPSQEEPKGLMARGGM
jgi:hypothetical protein|tara:strand:+ start:646 stop:1170 length:525 start_codon:yes stop_codon:yes gene_type:complete